MKWAPGPHAFWFGHYSGRYDQSVTHLKVGMEMFRSRGASALGLTELQDPERSAALHQFLAKTGWDLVSDRREELALAYSLEDWTYLHHDYELVTDLVYHRVGGARVKTEALFVVLTHNRSEERWLFSVYHAPSHLATRTRWRDYWRVTVAKAAGVGHAAMCQDYRKRFKINGGVLVGADWNLPLQQKWAEEWVEKVYAPYRMLRDRIVEPTHRGGGAYDAILGNKQVMRPKVRMKTFAIPGDDHDGVMVRVASRVAT